MTPQKKDGRMKVLAHVISVSETLEKLFTAMNSTYAFLKKLAIKYKKE